MLSMLVTTKVKVNRFCSVLKMFTKVFSYQRAEATALRLLLPFDHAMSPRWPLTYSTTRLLDASYRLSYRAMNKLLDERRAEVLDGRRLLPREPELVGQAVEPHEVGCLQCCGVGPQYVALCPLSTDSTSPA